MGAPSRGADGPVEAVPAGKGAAVDPEEGGDAVGVAAAGEATGEAAAGEATMGDWTAPPVAATVGPDVGPARVGAGVVGGEVAGGTVVGTVVAGTAKAGTVMTGVGLVGTVAVGTVAVGTVAVGTVAVGTVVVVGEAPGETVTGEELTGVTRGSAAAGRSERVGGKVTEVEGMDGAGLVDPGVADPTVSVDGLDSPARLIRGGVAVPGEAPSGGRTVEPMRVMVGGALGPARGTPA